MHIREARAHHEAGRGELAIRCYTAALANSDAAATWHRLGRVYERVGEWEAAVGAYEGALARNDRWGSWHHHLGRAYEQVGRWEAAASAYEAALSRNDRPGSWHYRLGRVYERVGEWEVAVGAYEAALVRNDRPGSWHYRLGRVYERIERWEAAASAYETALARNDRRATWHYRLGRVYERLGLERAAEHRYVTGLARTPDATSLDRALLAAGHQRFPARRKIARFVEAHLDGIRAEALKERRPPRESPAKVYVFWAQGMRHAPPVVQRCYRELTRHHSSDDVVVLDDTTVSDLVEIPGYVRAKLGSNWTKFSDVARLELLWTYGGVWMDATCLPRTRVLDVTPGLLSSGFFAFRLRGIRLSTWFLASEPGTYILALWRQAQYAYWRHFDAAADYYLVHHLFEALYHLDEEFRARWDGTPRISARAPVAFQRAMHEPYEPIRFQSLMDGSFVHKLTYKYATGTRQREHADTLLDRLLRCGPHEGATHPAPAPAASAWAVGGQRQVSLNGPRTTGPSR